MWAQAFGDFLMLFVTIDPVGTVALYVSLTSGMGAVARRRVAGKAVVVAGVVLLGFLIAGQILLSELGIRLVSFQVAGGVILFLFGLQMVFGAGVIAERPLTDNDHDIAVFPLAMPAIASPGAIMAVVLLTDNHRQSIPQQILTAAVLILVLVITWLALIAAQPIHRILGSTGANVLIRVLGLVLAALAAEQVITGIENLLKGGAI